MQINSLLEYSVFPNSFIRNNKLTPHQKILFEIFCSFDHIQEDGKRKGWCYPSLETISYNMGISIRAVQVHLKALVELGLITIVYRNNGSRSEDKSSVYVLNILPGISEEDRQKIAHTRNIEIKNLISGFNTIKINTTTGMQYISEEEFDLEYIVTGQRSSVVIDGEIQGTDSDVFKEDEEGFEGISFKQSRVKITPNKNTGIIDELEKLKNGRYTVVSNDSVRNYFKFLYEQKYPGFIYDIKSKTVQYEDNIISSRIREYGTEKFIVLMKHFIEHYERLFFNEKYPKPNIGMFNLAWIMNKLDVDYNQYITNQEKIDDYKISDKDREGEVLDLNV
jgi:DNA-binding transcriptional ArsR family regulator